MSFKRDGNRKAMEKNHYDRREHLVLFALAELCENNGRFLPQIVNGLFTVCEETFWGVAAHMPNQHLLDQNIPDPDEPHIDLFAAETAEHLAMIAYLLKKPLEEFCPEILRRVYRELEVRIKSPYIHSFHLSWMGYDSGVNNWNPWILSNLLTVFLLSEHSEERLHRALKKMLTEIQHYYDTLPSDGGCGEGPGYWNRAGASLFEFIYQLKQATDGELDLFDDEKLRSVAAYMKKIHIASDLFVTVADAHAKGLSKLMLLLYGFARETGQEDLMNFSAAVYRERTADMDPFDYKIRTVRRIIYHAEFVPEIERYPVSLPIHSAAEYLPDLQIASVRGGDMFLCVKGGCNGESHNHNDVGSFVLYDGVTPVLIDVGINTYTKYTFNAEYRYTYIPWTRSSYHNLPVVNGVEEHYGGHFRADSFTVREDGVDVSFASAYESAAGISSLTRETAVTEKGMTCTDCFTFTDREKRDVTEVLMSILPTKVENGDAIIGGRYRVHSDNGEITEEFIPFEDKNLESDWKTSGVTRIMISSRGKDTVTFTVEKI